MRVLFWIAIGIVLYTYVFYPLLLLLMTAIKSVLDSLRFLVTRKGRRISDLPSTEDADLPKVTLMIAARNEEALITEKIENFLAIDYPPEKLELLIGSDASEDQTVSLVQATKDTRVRVLDYRERSGKIGVLQKLLAETDAEIVHLSDANTFLQPDAIRKIVRHFADPLVGAVCGELRLQAPDGSLQSEGAYWRYETILKTLEGGFQAVLGANGGNYAVRRSLFPYLPPDTIIEDFVIPLMIRQEGYRTPFEPESIALERNPVDAKGEFRRRARIGAGCLQALPMIAPLLFPQKGMVAFTLWSHKIFRWMVPFALIGALVTNAFLLERTFFVGTLVAQLACYALAGVGWIRHTFKKPLGLFGVPYLFVVLNLALAVGYVRFLLGRHRVTWARTKRVKAA